MPLVRGHPVHGDKRPDVARVCALPNVEASTLRPVVSRGRLSPETYRNETKRRKTKTGLTCYTGGGGAEPSVG